MKTTDQWLDGVGAITKRFEEIANSDNTVDIQASYVKLICFLLIKIFLFMIEAEYKKERDRVK